MAVVAMACDEPLYLIFNNLFIMCILFDISKIENSSGNGEERIYVNPVFHGAMSRRQLSESISRSCSLKPSDVEAVLTELGELMCERLSMGHRVYLPEIGYFRLSLSMQVAEGQKKVTGKDVRVRNVTFRPMASMLDRIRKSVRFERSYDSRSSVKYSEDDMVSAVREYVSSKGYLTKALMMSVFGLRKRKASEWLERLVVLGVLRREGRSNSYLYFLKKE